MKRTKLEVVVVALAVMLAVVWAPACELGDSDKDVGGVTLDVVQPEDSGQTEDMVQPEDSARTEDRAVPEEDGGTVDVPHPQPCGDGLCGSDEDPCTCPEDCLTEGACCESSDCPQPLCGSCCVVQCVDHTCSGDIWLDDCCWNGKCEEGETPENCPEDCPGPVCGNGLVEPGEECDDSNTVAGDGCGETCQLEGTECGDGVCSEGENPCNCEKDCPLSLSGACCTAADCPQPKCGPCCVVQCVDYQCSEPIWLDDCCWNGECEEGETPENCPEDCPPICADNFDCPYKMKCSDGGCVDVGCVDKGGLLPGALSPQSLEHMATECCESLTQISYAGNYDENCAFVALEGGPGGACTECGNGLCEEQETKCNCPEDCQPTDCIPEGDAQCDYEDWALECCPGLVPLSMIPVDEDGQCGITLPCGFVCTKCGDGECGTAENKCNCQQDCPGY